MTQQLDNNKFSHLTEVFRKLKHQSMLDDWPIYQIFGLNMASDYPFGDRLPSGMGEVDIVFTSQDETPFLIDWDEIEPVYTSIYRTKNNEPVWFFYKLDDTFIVRYTAAADFYIVGNTILCCILGEALKDAYVMNLLPAVLTIWLELRGIPCLHASAVVAEDRAIVFLADSGHGKSTLASSFLQAGYSFLTDDKLPIVKKNNIFFGQPGFPLMRLFPEAAEQLIDDYQNLDFVIPGSSKRVAHIERDVSARFCRTAMPLACIYILERENTIYSEPEISITDVLQRDAVVELIRYGFTTRITETLGSSVARLNFYAQLAASVSVKRLTYPTGHDRLPDVRSSILKDLASLI